jgi:hypothetical protein
VAFHHPAAATQLPRTARQQLYAQQQQQKQHYMQQHFMQQQKQQQQPFGHHRADWHAQRQPLASALRAAQQKPSQQHEQQQQLRTPEQQQEERHERRRRGSLPPTAVPMARTASSLIRTRTEAATTIQAAWRGWRLARHRRIVRSLAAAARALAEARQQFQAATAENALGAAAPGSQAAAAAALSHQQYLKCQELATRPLLDLDAVSCSGVPELRALRKRLVTEAIGLLDEITGAYKAAVTASVSAAAPAVASSTARSSFSGNNMSKPVAGSRRKEQRVRVQLVVPGCTREVAVQTD